MCFNATASYASGLAISAVGVAALPAVEDRRELAFAGLGAIVAATLLGIVLTGAPAASEAHAHLSYDLPVRGGWPLLAGYAAATCGPLLASSHHHVVRAGLAMVIALAISAFAYAANVASVWCFLAACVSLVISGHYLLDRRRRRARWAASRRPWA